MKSSKRKRLEGKGFITVNGQMRLLKKLSDADLRWCLQIREKLIIENQEKLQLPEVRESEAHTQAIQKTLESLNQNAIRILEELAIRKNPARKNVFKLTPRKNTTVVKNVVEEVNQKWDFIRKKSN